MNINYNRKDDPFKKLFTIDEVCDLVNKEFGFKGSDRIIPKTIS